MSKRKNTPPSAMSLQLSRPRTYSNAHAEIIAATLHVAPVGEYDAWHKYTPKADGKSVINEIGVYERIATTPDDVLMAWFRAGEEEARRMRRLTNASSN